MTTRDVQTTLKQIGFPIVVDGSFGNETFNRVKDFQQGFGWRDLLVDGYAGGLTQAALLESLERGGRCSNYFFYREYASGGNKQIKVHRVLVRAMDRYREAVGSTRIVSGYRDPAWNRTQGGQPNSQHLYGSANDLVGKVSLNAARNMRLFSGIGIAEGMMVHGDIRGQDNVPATTIGTVDNPMIWYY